MRAFNFFRRLVIILPLLVCVGFAYAYLSVGQATESVSGPTSQGVPLVTVTAVDVPKGVSADRVVAIESAQKDLEKRHNELAVAHGKWDGIKDASLLAINKVGILLNWVAILMGVIAVGVAGAAYMTFRAKDDAVKTAVSGAVDVARALTQELIDKTNLERTKFDTEHANELRASREKHANELATILTQFVALKTKYESELEELKKAASSVLDSRQEVDVSSDQRLAELERLVVSNSNDIQLLRESLQASQPPLSTSAASSPSDVVTDYKTQAAAVEYFDLSEPHVRRVFNAYIAGDYAGAIDAASLYIDSAERLSSDQYLVYFRGLAYGRQDRHGDAIQDFTALINDSTTSANVRAEALYNRAFNFWDAGKPEPAIADMTSATALFESSNYAYAATRKIVGQAALQRWRGVSSTLHEMPCSATSKIVGVPTKELQTLEIEFDVREELPSMTSFTFELRPPISAAKATLATKLLSAPPGAGTNVLAKSATGTNLRASVWLRTEFGKKIMPGKYLVQLVASA